MEARISRKERKARTRDALKAAALRCFGELGYAQSSIGSITEAAAVAHGTFYVHFPSKDALLDELLADFNERLAQRLEPLWHQPAAQGLDELLLRTAELFLEHWEHEQGFIEAYVERLGAGLKAAELRDGLNPPAAALLTGRLEALLAALGADTADALLVRQALLGMWLRVGMQHLFQERIDRRRTARALARLTLGALRGLAEDKGPEEGAAQGRDGT
jgi:AcrR family transcriptional regulator